MGPLYLLHVSPCWMMLFVWPVLGFIQIHSLPTRHVQKLSIDHDNEHDVKEILCNTRHSLGSIRTRAEFLSLLSFAAVTTPSIVNAFDGGVGGLGKTRPQTGVIFRDPDAAAETTQSKSGQVSYELVAPDGSPVFLSFASPWPPSKSSAGIETRDISGGFESSFVQVCDIPKNISLDSIKPKLISDAIFGTTGKFGMYGSPTDVRLKKLSSGGDGNTALYQATFTTLTPAMRESDRKAYISAAVVGDGLFLLVTSTTSARFSKLEGELKKVAESYSAVQAPLSNLNQRK